LGEDHLSIHAPHPILPIYGDTLLKNSIWEPFFLERFDCRFSALCIIFGANPLLNFAPFPFYYGIGPLGPVRNIILTRVQGPIS
jgi:hypothetical protein